MLGVSTPPLVGPVLTAAATTIRPLRHAVSTAAATGSDLYDEPWGVAPSDRFTMRMLYCALCSRTHCRPARTDDTRPRPWPSSTFTSTMLARGAMPTNCPADLVPSPPIVPATCVPCPPSSGRA